MCQGSSQQFLLILSMSNAVSALGPHGEDYLSLFLPRDKEAIEPENMMGRSENQMAVRAATHLAGE